MNEKLIALYKRMAEITNPSCIGCKDECKAFSDKKYRCCSNEYCEKANRFAKYGYGIKLEPTGNKELMFMGEHGCTVPPHLRPICTIHVCSITWAMKSYLGDKSLTDEYFSLRDKIIEEERLAGREIFY